MIGTPPTMIAYSTRLFSTREIFRTGIVLDLIGIVVLVTAVVYAGYPRFVFFPTVEGDNVVVSLTMPQGTPIQKTTRIIADIERAARGLCDDFDRDQPSDGKLLEHMLATVGSQPYAQEQAQNGGNRDARHVRGSAA